MKRVAVLALAPLLVAAGDPAVGPEHGETSGRIVNRTTVPAPLVAAANDLIGRERP